MPRIDHVIVAARTLDDGVAWCEATLGITPGPGGVHALMGTHNRLFSVATPGHSRAYFEIIAIDPQAGAPGRKRWFDLDDASMHDALERGPRLVHWAAGVGDIARALALWSVRGIDAGRAVAATRDTQGGTLRWQISVRDDGRRLFGGALPTLIEWGGAHPTDTMPPSGVTLSGLRLRATEPARLAGALADIGLVACPVAAGGDGFEVELHTPRGVVVLDTRR